MSPGPEPCSALEFFHPVRAPKHKERRPSDPWGDGEERGLRRAPHLRLELPRVSLVEISGNLEPLNSFEMLSLRIHERDLDKDPSGATLSRQPTHPSPVCQIERQLPGLSDRPWQFDILYIQIANQLAPGYGRWSGDFDWYLPGGSSLRHSWHASTTSEAALAGSW